MPTACQCTLCPGGAPSQYKVRFSGITNIGSCADCTDLNANDYLVTFSDVTDISCSWVLNTAPGPCSATITGIELTAEKNPDGSATMSLYLLGTHAVWRNSNVTDCISQPLALDYVGPPTGVCGWGGPATITPAPLDFPVIKS